MLRSADALSEVGGDLRQSCGNLGVPSNLRLGPGDQVLDNQPLGFVQVRVCGLGCMALRGKLNSEGANTVLDDLLEVFLGDTARLSQRQVERVMAAIELTECRSWITARERRPSGVIS